MLHNTLEYKSSLLCIAWVWAEISSITINTVCLHEGTAQRDVCLQIHLSNTADMTDRRAVRWQMPARWWPSCRTCSWWQERKKKKWGFGKDGLKQTAEWMDGWTAGDAQHFSHSSALFLGVCLSLLPFICSGAEKTRSFPPLKKPLWKQKAVEEIKLHKIILSPTVTNERYQLYSRSISSFHQWTC